MSLLIWEIASDDGPCNRFKRKGACRRFNSNLISTFVGAV